MVYHLWLKKEESRRGPLLELKCLALETLTSTLLEFLESFVQLQQQSINLFQSSSGCPKLKIAQTEKRKQL